MQVASHTGGVRVVGATSAQPPPHQHPISAATAAPVALPPLLSSTLPPPPQPPGGGGEGRGAATAGVQRQGSRGQPVAMTAGAPGELPHTLYLKC